MVLEETRLDFQRHFQIFHAGHKFLADYPRERLSVPPGSRKGGKTLVDWQRGNVHCILIQHLENLSNHSNNWFHSAIPVLPVSSRLLSRSSINLLLEIVANVDT